MLLSASGIWIFLIQDINGKKVETVYSIKECDKKKKTGVNGMKMKKDVISR